MADLIDYQQQLVSLLPRGAAWQFDAGTQLSVFTEAMAVELVRVDGRAADMLKESLPHQTYEMISEWEEVAGLPDLCTGTVVDLAARQKALVAKLTATGGQSIAYFLQILGGSGYQDATITEPKPMLCTDLCDEQLWDEKSVFTWIINIPEAVEMTGMTVQDGCQSFLENYGIPAIECVINRIKPSHTFVLFNYQILN